MQKEDGEILEISGFLGTTTNNVAEYAGLLEALATAKSEGATDVEIVSDSLLLVQQMLGTYRVKHPNLVPLFRRAKSMSLHFPKFKIYDGLHQVLVMLSSQNGIPDALPFITKIFQSKIIQIYVQIRSSTHRWTTMTNSQF